MLVLKGCAEDGILPVGSLAEDRGVAETVVLEDHTLRRHVVVILGKLAEIEHVDALSLTLPSHHAVVRKLGLACLTALCGDKYNAVGTLCTVDGCGRSILQHFHADDVRRVE